MNLLVGKIVQELLQKEGSPSVKDFAAMMGLSTRTLYNIFSGSTSMTFDQVVRASELLSVDIGEEYYARTGIAKPGNGTNGESLKTTKQEMITINFAISGTHKNYAQNFGELLAKIRQEVSALGFRII